MPHRHSGNVSRSPSDHACPGCGGRMAPFFSLPDLPTNSCILMDTPEEARAYPRGDIRLGFCDTCGFIGNLAFDARLADYSGRYEETQGFSPTFQRFHRTLAEDLVQRYRLQGRSVLEIGCGKGEFLALLARAGIESGLGFDPGFDDRRGVLDGQPGIRVIKDFYTEKDAHHTADLVCCKMTLEHIRDTGAFLRLCRQAMRPGGDAILYLQVPETFRIFRDCAFEDIYYEHCSYFTAESLANLVRSQGLEILRLYTTYGDQYLAVEARLGDAGRPVPPAEDAQRLRRLVASFAGRCTTKVREWQVRMTEAARKGPIVVWGSGSKAVSFLNAVDRQGVVERVVDINPHRQRHFMPGTAQPIVAPEDLSDLPPSTIVVMNAIYRHEIMDRLDRLGIRPRMLLL